MRWTQSFAMTLLMSSFVMAQTKPVESLGDPENWQFTGIASFDVEQVRRALANDFDVLLAAHPSAPLEEFLPSLRARIAQGYRHVGFPDVEVSMNVDQQTNRVNVDVNEGPRYSARQVLFEGVPKPQVQTIIQKLTQDHVDSEATPTFADDGGVLKWMGPNDKRAKVVKPLWVRGEPARFDEPTVQRIRDRVGAALTDTGLASAEFTVSIQHHTGSADLVVAITEPGPTTVIQEIQVQGNERSSSAEIIEHLGVEPGVTLTRQLREQLLRTLWECGRFADHRLETEPTESGVKLQIHVTEVPGAPPLTEPLSREAETLLKFRRWLIAGDGRQFDLVATIHLEQSQAQIVLSNSGLLLTLNDPHGVHNFAYGLELTDEIGLYDLVNHRKLVLPRTKSQLTLESTLSVNAANPDKPFHYGFNMGIRSVERGVIPMSVRTSLSPAFFLAVAGHESSRAMWQGAVMSLETRTGVFCIDSRTGRLLEFRIESDAGREIATVVPMRGHFEHQRKQIAEVSKECPNQFETTAPVSSVLRFLCETGIPDAWIRTLSHDKDLREISSALGTLIDRDILRPVDQWLTTKKKKSEDPFELPTSADPVHGKVRTLARLAVPAADHLFPRDSWAWRTLRESAFVITGHGSYAQTELRQMLDSHDCGPIAHWILAELLSRVDRNAAAIVAARGRARLDASAFRQDCRILLQRHQQWLIPVPRWLGELTEPEVQSLAKLLSIDPASLQEHLRGFDTSTEEEALNAILAILERLWDERWRVAVDDRMWHIVYEKTLADKHRDRSKGRVK